MLRSAAQLAAGSLVELLPQFESPPAPIYLLTPPGRFPSRAVRALTDHLEQALTPSVLVDSLERPSVRATVRRAKSTR